MVGAENQDCYGIDAFILLLQFKYYKVKNQATNKKSSLRYLCTLHFVKLWSFFSLHEWIACFKTPEILENWGEKKKQLKESTLFSKPKRKSVQSSHCLWLWGITSCMWSHGETQRWWLVRRSLCPWFSGASIFLDCDSLGTVSVLPHS